MRLFNYCGEPWQYAFYFNVLGKTNAHRMKSIEFEVTVGDTGKISVPANLKDALRGKKVRVVLSYEPEASHSSDEVHYNKGYDQKDTLYDKY